MQHVHIWSFKVGMLNNEMKSRTASHTPCHHGMNPTHPLPGSLQSMDDNMPMTNLQFKCRNTTSSW